MIKCKDVCQMLPSQGRRGGGTVVNTSEDKEILLVELSTLYYSITIKLNV